MATPSQSPLWQQLLSWFAILTLITIAVIDTLVSKQDRPIAIFSFIILALNLIFGCLQAIPSIRKHLTGSIQKRVLEIQFNPFIEWYPSCIPRQA
jgi:uncharacterized membrane protein